MEKSWAGKTVGNRKLKFTLGGIGLVLLLAELSVAFDYLASGLYCLQPELFSWWTSLSMMAWAIADKIAWHPGGVVATAEWMPLSAVPFGLIAVGLLFSRRDNL
jgi:hypothetical protein